MLSLALVAPAPAPADTFAVGPWTLYESWGTYSAYFETSSRDRFRWTADTPHSTALALHDPYDGYRVTGPFSVPAHYQEYVDLGCYCSNYVRIQLRGRSQYGTQSNRYGNFIL